jgi:hypothetical protein
MQGDDLGSWLAKHGVGTAVVERIKDEGTSPPICNIVYHIMIKVLPTRLARTWQGSRRCRKWSKPS